MQVIYIILPLRREINRLMKINTLINLAKTAKSGLLGVLVAVFAVLAGSTPVAAQQRVDTGSESDFAYDFRIYFPFDVSDFRESYLENQKTLATLDSVLAVHGAESLNSLQIIAQSSPEGNYDYNMNLSMRRAKSMQDYLLKRIPTLEGKIDLQPRVAPWPKVRTKGDLVRLRYAAFRLIFPFDINLAEMEAEIDKALACEIEMEPEETVPVEDFHFDYKPIKVDFLQTKYKETIFALKTNLLYDAVTALNFEIEVPIGKRYSVLWEDVFPWWETGNKYCFQHWEMGPEARFWFKPWKVHGTDKLQGFFAGVYGMSAKYDFQYDRSINYQGEYWSAGVTAGWTKSLGKTKWGNLEFSLGVGYLHTDYRGYMPADDYSLLIRNPNVQGNAKYFGPTKAKVSLVIPINITRKYNYTGGKR